MGAARRRALWARRLDASRRCSALNSPSGLRGNLLSRADLSMATLAGIMQEALMMKYGAQCPPFMDEPVVNYDVIPALTEYKKLTGNHRMQYMVALANDRIEKKLIDLIDTLNNTRMPAEVRRFLEMEQTRIDKMRLQIEAQFVV